MWPPAILDFGLDPRRNHKKMIEYIEEFFGLEAGVLANTDFGIMVSFILLAVLIFMVFKLIIVWFDKLFNRG